MIRQSYPFRDYISQVSLALISRGSRVWRVCAAYEIIVEVDNGCGDVGVAHDVETRVYKDFTLQLWRSYFCDGYTPDMVTNSLRNRLWEIIVMEDLITVVPIPLCLEKTVFQIVKLFASRAKSFTMSLLNLIR